MSTIKSHPVVSVLTIGYAIGFTIFGIAIKSRATIPYAALMVAIIPLMVFLDQRIHFSRQVLVALSLWGALHMAGGIVPIGNGRALYYWWIVDATLKFDQFVHFVGFGAGTVACWEGLKAKVGADVRMSPGAAVVIALAGMGLGAINEVIEFFASLVIKDSNVGGYANTGWDLVFNTLGCSAAAFYIYRRERRRDNDRVLT